MNILVEIKKFIYIYIYIYIYITFKNIFREILVYKVNNSK